MINPLKKDEKLRMIFELFRTNSNLGFGADLVRSGDNQLS
jgi:hypothetical protein